MPNPDHIFTPEKRATFLDALEEYGNVSEACRVVDISRRTAYNHRNADAEFRKLWDEAHELGIYGLEDEARRRAFRGVKKPVYQGGQHVGDIRDYSDTLLIFLMKGAMPEKYRENIHATGDVSLKVIDLADTEEEADEP